MNELWHWAFAFRFEEVKSEHRPDRKTEEMQHKKKSSGSGILPRHNFFTDTPPQRHRITMNYHHLSSSEINYLPFDLLTEKETSSSIHPST
jgi:hypothetical protein